MVSKDLEIKELSTGIEMNDQTTSDQVESNENNVHVDEGVKYACYHCDQQFTTQSVLTRHIKSVHEGVKNACNQCGQQFAYQHDLTSHIQSKHKGVKYACNQCDYQATRQDNLTSHIKRKHC